jgi:hypothetical protein
VGTKTTESKRPDKARPPDKPAAEDKPMAGKVPGNEALLKLTAATMADLDLSFKMQTNRDLPDLIKGLTPVFDPAPIIDGNGILIVRGYYPVKKNKLTFKLRFRFENSNRFENSKWNLAESNVDYDIAGREE